MADSRFALPNQDIVEQLKENAKMRKWKHVISYTDLVACLVNMGNRKKVNTKTGRIYEQQQQLDKMLQKTSLTLYF